MMAEAKEISKPEKGKGKENQTDDDGSRWSHGNNSIPKGNGVAIGRTNSSHGSIIDEEILKPETRKGKEKENNVWELRQMQWQLPRYPHMTDQQFLDSLPYGFQFQPTDEEIIVHYLKKKVNGENLEPNRIEEVAVYQHNPQDLLKKCDYRYSREDITEWYFFTSRDKKYPNGKRPDRAAGDGYWKPTGSDVKIVVGGQILGSKRTLVFYKGKQSSGVKTNWLMQEYVLENTTRKTNHSGDMKLDDWVLCKVYKNKRDKERTKTSTQIQRISPAVSQVQLKNNISAQVGQYQECSNSSHVQTYSMPPTGESSGNYYDQSSCSSSVYDDNYYDRSSCSSSGYGDNYYDHSHMQQHQQPIFGSNMQQQHQQPFSDNQHRQSMLQQYNGQNMLQQHQPTFLGNQHQLSMQQWYPRMMQQQHQLVTQQLYQQTIQPQQQHQPLFSGNQHQLSMQQRYHRMMRQQHQPIMLQPQQQHQSPFSGNQHQLSMQQRYHRMMQQQHQPAMQQLNQQTIQPQQQHQPAMQQLHQQTIQPQQQHQPVMQQQTIQPQQQHQPIIQQLHQQTIQPQQLHQPIIQQQHQPTMEPQQQHQSIMQPQQQQAMQPQQQQHQPITQQEQQQRMQQQQQPSGNQNQKSMQGRHQLPKLDNQQMQQLLEEPVLSDPNDLDLNIFD